jgi:hypothetical protein
MAVLLVGLYCVYTFTTSAIYRCIDGIVVSLNVFSSQYISNNTDAFTGLLFHLMFSHYNTLATIHMHLRVLFVVYCCLLITYGGL